MKRVLAVVFLIIILLAAWYLFFKTDKSAVDTSSQTTTSNSVKKHSESFDTQIATMINAYMGMKNAFVDADLAGIKAKTSGFIAYCN